MSRVMVYIRKDVADNSETIEREGQTVTSNDYHKVWCFEGDVYC